MKKGALFLFLVIFMMLSAYVSYADFPDADGDKVPDSEDKCPGTPQSSRPVDNQGCSCDEKTAAGCNPSSGIICCASDNKPCTDDCAPDNIGRAVCNYMDNTNTCPNGICYNGQCRTNMAREQIRCVFSGASSQKTCTSSKGSMSAASISSASMVMLPS